jgi:hypothetical protein|tara:strand:+ start:3103 stop:3408 length:306 start_codon:yes stop_codon:yes gene_type:complete
MAIKTYNEGIGRIYSDKLEDIDNPIVARLDYLFWGKSCNLILCFTTDDMQFKLSVFNGNNYHSRDKLFCFRDESLLGEIISLDLYYSKNGYINIKSAKVVN